MTTFQEISTSRRANRRFHNQCVRQTIGFIRYHADLARKGSDMSNGLLRSYRATLVKGLEDRANYNYFDGGRA